VTRVDSITNFPRIVSRGDELLVNPLLDSTQTLSKSLADALRVYATSEPQLRNLLIDATGRYAALNITLNMPGDDAKGETIEAAAAVRELVSNAESKWGGFQVYSSGTVLLNNAFFESAKNDFLTLIPVMLFGVIILTGLMLRSWLSIVSLFSVMVLSTCATLGATAWLGISLTAPTVSTPIILATVIVASGVHLISAIQHHTGSGITRTINGAKETFAPIIVTGVTTIIGFLSMNMSDAPPFRDLGNIVALGVAFSLAFTLTLVPYLHIRYLPLSANKVTTYRSSLILAIKNIVDRHHRIIIFIGTPLAIIVSAFAITNTPNDDFVSYFDESITFRKHTDFINHNLTGIYSIEFSIEENTTNGILKPDNLVKVDKFVQWLRSQQEVTGVITITDVIKEINRDLHSNDISYYTLPKTQTAAAQYFLIYELGLPQGKSISDRVTMDKSGTRITARLNNLDSTSMLAFEKRALAFWDNINKNHNLTIRYSSPTLMFSHIGVSNTRSMITGAMIALILISILISLMFRSLSLGALSFFTNLLPVSLAFGIWAIVDGQISMGLAGVSSMVIGIVVDDTIHFLHQLRRHRLQGGLRQATLDSLGVAGPAILISSIVLILGFLTLSLSSFEKNASMGILTAATILLALIADLILIPAFLLWASCSTPLLNAKLEPQKELL
jgi:predicted RND superfamily exporter protein